MALLDPEVVMRSDGGGRVNAARKPIVGAGRVSRAIVTLARKGMLTAQVRLVDVNGAPGLLVREPSGALTVAAFTVEGGASRRST